MPTPDECSAEESACRLARPLIGCAPDFEIAAILRIEQQFGKDPVRFTAIEDPEPPAILPGEWTRMIAIKVTRQRRWLAWATFIIWFGGRVGWHFRLLPLQQRAAHPGVKLLRTSAPRCGLFRIPG